MSPRLSPRRVLPSIAALALLAGALSAVAPAGAAPTASADSSRAKPTVETIADHLVGPLSVAQAPDGTRYWADAFDHRLYKQATDGTVSVVYRSRRVPAHGVSADGGELRFVTGSPNNRAGGVWTLDASGKPVLLGDTWKYERKNNPDGKFTYGLLGASKSCRDKLPDEVPGRYTGVKETHAYGVATGAGVTYIADAGANTILALSASGELSTVAALKPVKVKITKKMAKALKLPDCVVGKKYALEAVPTDIEYGPDGQLYVTSLPGGPEDGSLGANGRVLRIDPATGKVRTVVRNLLTPTGLAVTASGDIYVAQLFRGVISKVRAGSGKARTYLRLPFPAAIEATPTGLLATHNAVPMGTRPKGKVVTITP